VTSGAAWALRLILLVCSSLGKAGEAWLSGSFLVLGHVMMTTGPGLFSFLYLKKIKISKIYVRFEKFQNYPGRPRWATGPRCNFFSLNLQRGPWSKKK